MAHGVDPAVKEMETPELAAILDHPRAEAEPHELGPRHDAMLQRCQFGQRNVGCADLGLTLSLNAAHPVYVGASGRPKGAPPPFRHTLNAQFVTKRRDRVRIQVVWDTAGRGSPAAGLKVAAASSSPLGRDDLREASATPPRISASPPIDAAVIGSSSRSAP